MNKRRSTPPFLRPERVRVRYLNFRGRRSAEGETEVWGRGVLDVRLGHLVEARSRHLPLNSSEFQLPFEEIGQKRSVMELLNY